MCLRLPAWSAVLLLALCTALPAPVGADIIAEYTLTGANPLPPSMEHPLVTASPISKNGVTSANEAPLFFVATDWPEGAFAGSYFEVTLTPDAGHFIDFAGGSTSYKLGTNPTFTTELRTSLDGFSTSLGSHTSSPGISSYVDDLSSLGQVSGPITFRWYGFVDSNSGTSGFFADPITFNAAVVAVASTPEPGAMALFGIGLAGVIGSYRRRRTRAGEKPGEPEEVPAE